MIICEDCLLAFEHILTLFPYGTRHAPNFLLIVMSISLTLACWEVFFRSTFLQQFLENELKIMQFPSSRTERSVLDRQTSSPLVSLLKLTAPRAGLCIFGVVNGTSCTAEDKNKSPCPVLCNDGTAERGLVAKPSLAGNAVALSPSL